MKRAAPHAAKPGICALVFEFYFTCHSYDINSLDVELHCPAEAVGEFLGDERRYGGRIRKPFYMILCIDVMTHTCTYKGHVCKAVIHTEQIGELILVTRMRHCHCDRHMEGICLDNQADVSGFLTIAGFCKDTMGKLRMAQTRPLWYNHRQRGKESHRKERGTGWR